MSVKRTIDVVLSAIGIIVTSPMMLVIAVAIKLESRGPICYGCTRVGQHGLPFKMLKFRTMVDSADRIDCKLCCDSDVRITRLGRFLRRSKLNELPQLFNVFRGDMSLVGPRPEDPKFIVHYPEKWSNVLSVKPGIVGPNQIFFRNEESLFPVGENPEAFYVSNILPQKLDADITYAQHHSLWGDLALLLRGVHVTLFEGRIRSRNVRGQKIYIDLITDVALSIAAYVLARYIRYETLQFEKALVGNLLLIAVINSCLFPITGLYNRTIRFFSSPDLFFLIRLVVLAGMLFTAGQALLASEPSPSRAVLFLYPCILLAFMGGARILKRIHLERKEREQGEKQEGRNAIIYGAGRVGAATVNLLKFEPGVKPIGFVDDNQSLQDRSILGLKVLGTGRDLSSLKELYQVQCVLIAFQPRSEAELHAVRQGCIEAGISEIAVVSPSTCLSEPAQVRTFFRRLRFSDELGMSHVPLLEQSSDFIERAALGIIGADDLAEHLCRELGRLGAEKVVVVDGSRQRLRLLHDRLQLHNRNIPELVTWYQPWGMHAETQKVLGAHDVRWIFCNHLNQPMPDASHNGSAAFLDFMETVRCVQMARRLGCHGLTLVSPRLSNCFSEQERSHHLLCEQYLGFAARNLPSTARLSTVRIPNLIEDESGIFKTTLRNISMDPFFSVPDDLMTFSSARYSARAVLNSLPMHGQGETYMQFPGLVLNLSILIDFHRQRCGQAVGKDPMTHPHLRSACDASLPESSEPSDFARTPVEHLRMITVKELPDTTSYERVMAQYNRYIDPEENVTVTAFLAELCDRANHLSDVRALGVSNQ